MELLRARVLLAGFVACLVYHVVTTSFFLNDIHKHTDFATRIEEIDISTQKEDATKKESIPAPGPTPDPTPAPTPEPTPGPTIKKDAIIPEEDESTIKLRRQAVQESYRKYGVPVSTPYLDDSVPFANFSHVKFHGCCGLGHRLDRLSSIAYIARVRGFALRPYWSESVFAVNDNNSTNKKNDLFLEMFDPYTREDFPYVNSTNQVIHMINNCPGTDNLNDFYESNGLESEKCTCTNDETQVHYDFYKKLRSKYKRRSIIDSFMNQHGFKNHTVFGIHIRAGNGEGWDFKAKGRGIQYNPSLWVSSLLKSLLASFPPDKFINPPMIFLATDDVSYRQRIKDGLREVGMNWPVVAMDQKFRKKGVLLDTRGSNEELESWHSMFQDMALLSHSNILIASMYSSFSQSLPLSLVLGANRNQQQQQVFQNKFCEAVDETVTHTTRTNTTVPSIGLYCYDEVMTWCCGKRYPRHNGPFDKKYVKSFFRPYGPELGYGPMNRKKYYRPGFKPSNREGGERGKKILVEPFPTGYSLSFEDSTIQTIKVNCPCGLSA